MIQAHHKSSLISTFCIASGVFLVFFGGTFHGPTRWVNGAILAALLCGAGALFVRNTRQGAVPAVSGVALDATAILFAFVLLRALTSSFPRFALPSVVGVTGGISLILLVATYCGRSPVRRRNLALGICLIIGASAAWSIFHWARGSTDRCVLPMGHHNLEGALLALTLPLQLSICTSREFGRTARIACAVAAGITAIAVLGTRSLGSVGGLGIALPLLLMGGWLEGRRTTQAQAPKFPSIREKSSWRQVVALLLALGLAGAVSLRTEAGSELSQRVNRIVLGGGDPSAGERAEFAKGAVSGLSQGHMWFGFGPGATPVVFPLDLRQRGVRQPEGVAVTHLHSTPVQILYEFGIAGLILATLLAGIAAAALIRKFRCAGNGTDRTILLGVVAGGVAYAAQCMGDVNILAPAVPIAACLLLGLGLAVPGGETPRSRPSATLSWLVGTSLLVVVPLVARASVAHRQHDLALAQITATTEPDVGRALSLFESAAQLDPNLGLYNFEAGLVAEEMARQDPKRAGQWLTRADRHFAAAIWAVPTAPGFALHLGWLRLQTNDSDRAASPIRLAAALEYRSTFALPLAASLEWNRGDHDRGIELFAQAVALRPISVCSEMLQREPVSSQLGRVLSGVAELDSISYEIAAELATECGDTAAIIDRVTLTRMDDQDPARSRALYVFRRRGLPTFSVPLEMRLTEKSAKLFRSRQATAVLHGVSRRIPPHNARHLIETDFPEARTHIPPGVR